MSWIMQKHRSKFPMFLLLCAFSLCSCKRDLILFPKQLDVNVSLLRETMLSVPMDMDINGDSLFVSDFRGDSLLSIYNINDGTLIEHLMPLGEGPNEFLSPVQYFRVDSNMLVYNRWHYTLGLYNVDYLDRKMSLCSERSTLSTDIDMIYPIGSDRFIASGRFKDSRFILFSLNSDKIINFGSYPSFMEGEDKIPNFPKFMFHQSMFGYNHEKGLLLAVTSHVLEYWSINGDSLILKKELLLSPYKYSYDYGDDWAQAYVDDGVERGVQRIFATDRRVYLLYNVVKQGTLERKRMNSELWVFDWEGAPLVKYHLDKPIITFCVSGDDRNVYCVVDNDYYSIGKISI